MRMAMIIIPALMLSGCGVTRTPDSVECTKPELQIKSMTKKQYRHCKDNNETFNPEQERIDRIAKGHRKMFDTLSI